MIMYRLQDSPCRNAFKEVSRQALLEECSQSFYGGVMGQHPTLWHSMGTLDSEQGVQ